MPSDPIASKGLVWNMIGVLSLAQEDYFFPLAMAGRSISRH